MPQAKTQNIKSKHQNVMINLPADAAARKDIPIGTGVLDYFPAAIAEVAKLSKVGNDQHNPGEHLHWARGKSTDQFDTIVRHLIQRGTFDTDGVRHSTKAAWRALALLQEELEAEAGFSPEELVSAHSNPKQKFHIDHIGRMDLPNGHYIQNPSFIDYQDGLGLQLCGGNVYAADGTLIGHLDPLGPRGATGTIGKP